MKDMFEHYNELPIEVKSVLEKYFEMENSYEFCANLVEDLEKVGWTCDYYLDAEPYGLRPIDVELKELEGYENC
jgi:hypothetical protein